MRGALRAHASARPLHSAASPLAATPRFRFRAPRSLVFVAYVVVSLVSLGKVNVPMFTALRRLTCVQSCCVGGGRY